MKFEGPIHRVNIVYHPDVPGAKDLEESLQFMTESAAVAFEQSQAKNPLVKSVKYLRPGAH